MKIISSPGSTMFDPINSNTSYSSPPGYRRISSIRSTTLNWLKGGNKNPNSSGGAKSKDSTNPLPNADDPVLPLPSTFIAPYTTIEMTSESATGTEAFSRPQFSLAYVTDHPQSRVVSPIALEEPPPKGVDMRASSPREFAKQPLTESPTNEQLEEIPAHSQAASSSQGGTGKKRTAAKLKMALNILRRRSNSNLRRTYGSLSEEHRMGRTKPRNKESSASSDMPTVETQILTAASPKAHIAPANGTTHARTVLTKQPPNETRRQRRGTVVSLALDENSFSNGGARPNGWLGFDGQPSSSQSSIPGITTVPGDDFSATSIIIPDGNGGGMNGSVVGAGLHPRPSSLKRGVSDEPQKKGESTTSLMEDSSFGNYPPRASNKIRPLSFSGMYNSCGSMKITEAASLESRVRELEAQVATLQSFLVQQRLSAASDTEPGTSNLATRATVVTLPPQDEVKRPATASSVSTVMRKETTMVDENVTPSVSTFTGTVDWSSIARSGPSTASIAPFIRAHSEVTTSDESHNYWEQRFETLDVTPGPSITSSKQSTVSTLTPGRGRGAESFRKQLPPNAISMAEYTELIAMVKREQRARKKLETRISRLQEQMTLVLHRQLLIEDRHHGTAVPVAETSSRGHLYSKLRKRTSNEVPTPYLTPPHEMGPTIFSEFNSSASTTESEYEDSYMGEQEGSELWETPTEEAQSVVGTSVDFPLLQHALRSDHLSHVPIMQPRTMSISQITEKASAAR